MGILNDMDSGTLEADVPSFVDANTGNFFSVSRTGDDARDFVIGTLGGALLGGPLGAKAGGFIGGLLGK